MYYNTIRKTLFPTATTFLFCLLCLAAASGQSRTPALAYTVSMPDPASHVFHVELSINHWQADSIWLKLPRWTPGYYQILDYANNLEHVSVRSAANPAATVKKANSNSWVIQNIKGKPFTVAYDVKAEKNFVAQSLLDSAHGYIVPAGLFLHIDKQLALPATITLNTPTGWKIATGLEPGKTSNEFTAADFDILYDCPILLGPLETLPPFSIKGIEHRFIGYQMGDFDKPLFMNNLQKVVAAAVDIIGDIPFKRYTFLGIGPGRGGIEHLNNTTVSFEGSALHTPEGANRMFNFLAHEYFHHYNVKRIRPLELGPFDYDHGSRTNLLWVSEGLSVYYEYLVVKRAGLASEQSLLTNLGRDISALENNPGRLHQSLKQASYNTWSDGPSGTQGKDPAKAISYYIKGPVVGLLLDFAIRNATQNKKSLDDVMRFMYWRYYKELGRGFTDGEFEQACETIAGTSLSTVFDYVYTTKELDYATYLGYAGLRVNVTDPPGSPGKRTFTLHKIENMTTSQSAIFRSWLGE